MKLRMLDFYRFISFSIPGICFLVSCVSMKTIWNFLRVFLQSIKLLIVLMGTSTFTIQFIIQTAVRSSIPLSAIKHQHGINCNTASHCINQNLNRYCFATIVFSDLQTHLLEQHELMYQNKERGDIMSKNTFLLSILPANLTRQRYARQHDK